MIIQPREFNCMNSRLQLHEFMISNSWTYYINLTNSRPQLHDFKILTLWIQLHDFAIFQPHEFNCMRSSLQLMNSWLQLHEFMKLKVCIHEIENSTSVFHSLLLKLTLRNFPDCANSFMLLIFKSLLVLNLQ